MIDYIYRLYEVETNKTFYIGRTIDISRRFSEHKLGAKHYKLGDEDKYMYASALNALNLEWSIEVIYECGPDTEFYEDYFVNKFKLAGEPIMNMKAGDLEVWNGREYASPSDYVKAREIAQNLAKNKPQRIKSTLSKPCDPDRMLFVGEKISEKFVSPAMKSILLRREQAKNKK